MANDLATRLQQRLIGTLADSARWFVQQMPPAYFSLTSEESQARHLEAVHAMRRSAEARMSVLDDPATGTVVVVGRPDRHDLLDAVRLAGDRPLKRVELHASRDRSLHIHAFSTMQEREPAVDPATAAQRRQAVLDAVCGKDASCKLAVVHFVDAVGPGYLARSSTERVARHIQAWLRLDDTEDVHVERDGAVDHGHAARVITAASGLQPQHMLMHLARALRRHDLRLARGYLDQVPPLHGKPGDAPVLIASAYVATPSGKAPGARVLAAFSDDLAAVRRAGHGALADAWAGSGPTLAAIELLRAGEVWAGQVLPAEHPWLDVGETAAALAREQSALVQEWADLVLERFRPGSDTSAKGDAKHAARLIAAAQALQPRAQGLLFECLVRFGEAILLTNAWHRDRLGLAVKLDPALLPATRFPNRPYGVILFAGPHARGFHVRFRASARGGLRLVLPRTIEQFARTRDRVLQEVYDLAWAQQLKNKDIPEGGSKCIALIPVGGDADAAVRQIADGLLDLILPPESMPDVVAAHGATRERDLIFLGPDENMTPARIVWVAERAVARGLPMAATLMSSKPGAGINHKEFGVTSEGLYRWIAAALPLAGLGTGPVRLTITGGPDGDLGGNLIRILHRERPERFRIVGIADGTGSAEDPAGLAWDELLRLVAASQGIAHFDRARLGAGGRVLPATDRAGEDARNTLHHRVPADLFVPCGGRPWTINDENWRHMLDDQGRPRHRAMVEGANIFISPAARRGLEDAGLLVIKDSSANKGGVICSSFEVLAGMALADAEFLRVKPAFVAGVVGAIRRVCDDEAAALLSAWERRRRATRLSDLSQQLSEEINRISALFEPAIAGHLDDAAMAASWNGHLAAHAAPCLLACDLARLVERIPRAHRVAILAKRLASTLAYREGMTWCQLHITPDRAWAALATWLQAERDLAALPQALAGVPLPGGNATLPVVIAGAHRELVRRRLGGE